MKLSDIPVRQCAYDREQTLKFEESLLKLGQSVSRFCQGLNWKQVPKGRAF